MIIAFTGKKNSGKSTAANYLVEHHNFELIQFKAVLVDMVRAMGLTEAEINGHLKEVPCALLCGQTPRHAMQTIGTEWGRDIIHADIWTNIWESRAREFDNVVVDDCRFINEAEVVEKLGGVIVRVERDQEETAGATHASETEMNNILPRHTVFNHQDIEALDNIIEGVYQDELVLS